MTILFNPTQEDLYECARNELWRRLRVYPRLVEQGNITQEEMDYELVCMETIRAILWKPE